jgi:starvation-inducible outer membrane lipoprotein
MNLKKYLIGAFVLTLIGCETDKKNVEKNNNAPKNVTNALFVGSTAELQKMFKGKKDA